MMQAWGHTIQALLDGHSRSRGVVAQARCAIPAREEIAAWYAQLSVARAVAGRAQRLIYRVPYGVRLGAGLALAAFGVLTDLEVLPARGGRRKPT